MNPGDYLVIRTNGWAAWWIRLITRSRFNHAAIYIGGAQIIEADPSGVQVAELAQYDGCPILWSNLRLTPERGELVVAAAHAQIGLEYGWLDVAAIALSSIGIVTAKLDDPDSRFCSQVVAVAFAQAGWPLCTKATNRITPGDLGRLIAHQPVPVNW